LIKLPGLLPEKPLAVPEKPTVPVRGGKFVPKVTDVVEKGEGVLMLVGEALGGLSLGLGGGECWQQEGCENGDNRDDDEKFDQSKTVGLWLSGVGSRPATDFTTHLHPPLVLDRGEEVLVRQALESHPENLGI
jgi:hypothetical protein